MPPNPRVAAVSRLLSRPGTRTDGVSGMVARNTATSVTTASSSSAARHNAKREQAWKYAGGKIQRASHLPVSQYHDHKDTSLPRRKQESNFFITINTNKSPSDERHKEAEYRLKGVLEVLAEKRFMAGYMLFGPHDTTGSTYRNDKFADVVENVEWKAAVETGEVMNRVHAHIWLTVTHYSQIQVNVHTLAAETKRLFNGRIGGYNALPSTRDELYLRRKPYVHVKLLPQSDWMTVIKSYIHKGM